ncbi:MAG: hypothetical protein HYU67_08565 [Flavobacteriia bacterium]|nr:hypothetical protein [Flavobacteriia bacterium]
MAEITLKIPNSKLNIFMELIQQLGFEANINDLHIPEEHKEFERNSIKTVKKEDYIP